MNDAQIRAEFHSLEYLLWAESERAMVESVRT